MGKKQQVQQRTKGNLQASSSSRAAQLLQNRNAGISNSSLGFCKDSQLDNAAPAVDATLSAAFRKLNKKEAVTKQKALTEILESISSENIDGCMPLWARNYQKISTDNDRKIRELSQHVQGKIVTTAGRNLAPHINSIIGPWLEGTCDVHHLTAHIASKSLEQSFTEEKLLGALRYCEKGIVKHLKDRLVSSPSTLSDMKITDPVDADEKYCRVIGSALRMLVKILQKAGDLVAIEELFRDPCVWSLGRSKHQQVRRHVYTLISEMCCLLPSHELPVPAYKTLTQQLNNCSHETSNSQYTALANVLYTHQAEFWSTVTMSDVRGQLLDAMKSKALLAGVLEPVYTQLAQITVLFFQHWIEEDKHMQWYEDVFNTAFKCLSQCKTSAERTTVLDLLVSVSSTINVKFGVQIPATLFPAIGSITSHLSTWLITEDTATQLLSIIDTATRTEPLALTLLKQIKQNEHELPNLKSICKMLEPVREQGDVYSYLSSRSAQQFALGNFDFVRDLLAHFEKLPACLYADMTNGDSPEIALINLTNSSFIPHFANSSYTPDQVTLLCQIFVHFLPFAEPPFASLVKTLVHSTEHRDTAFLAFLRAEGGREGADILSVDLMIETFTELSPARMTTSDSIIHLLVGLMSKLPGLQSHLLWFIWNRLHDKALQDEAGALHDTKSNYKLLTLLLHLEWGCVTVTKDPTRTDIVQLLLNKCTSAAALACFARIFHNVVAWNQAWSEPLLDLVTNFMDASNVERVTKDLVKVYRKHPKLLVSYLAGKLSPQTPSNALLVDLYERGDVFCVSGTKNRGDQSVEEEEDETPDGNQVFMKCCLEFITQCTLSDENDEVLVKSLYTLVNHSYIALETDRHMVVSILDSMSEGLVYALVNELVWNNNILLVYFVQDLLEKDREIDWSRVEGIPSLPADTLVNLSAVFGDKAFVDVLEARMQGELTKQDRLFALDHLVFAQKTAPRSDILEYLSETCLDGDLMDLALITEIFSTFQHILTYDNNIAEESSALVACDNNFAEKSTTTVSEDDVEFVLCSTATVIQATLDIVSAGLPSSPYHLTTALCAFNQLYHLIKRELCSKHGRFLEDWDLFFEPGIQDIVLVLHDKLIEQGLFPVVKYLSSVAVLAPSVSVKSFMKHALKREEDASFEECYQYLMSCYQDVDMALETQTALFYLLLHCQDLFKMGTQDEIMEEDVGEEGAEFLSPPKIFLASLGELDEERFTNEQEYESKLLKAAHVWILLLRHEASVPSAVIREHVEYLRSKRILAEFLDELVYFIKFSAKKYEIVPLEGITRCETFEPHQVASSCFMGVATVFPALLRNWWKRLDKELTMSVDKFVTAFVSPSLIKLETRLQKKPDDTLTIRPRPIVREVVATYSMDDITADLVINIAANHPLSPPTVSCERQVGVPVSTWRSWMLQMTAMFQNQNSSIVDALEHWRKNMNNQFEGLESCMICFSVVQGPKKLLPKPCCKTCKKKFHSACLYKWFSTSGKSSCPMCRSPFTHSSGLRARLQGTQEPEEEGQ